VRIGIDLGGTKIEAVALDDGGETLARRRVATPKDDYAATVQAMVSLIEMLEREAGTRGSVGIGTPGALSPASGLVKNANSTCLIGQALDRDLAAAIGREVRVANDANCFALSEARDGAARGARLAFGVIIGTGTGGGIAIDGAIWTGVNAIAGEWGHNPLPWPEASERPGPRCYCSRRGCIETFLSGPGFARDYESLGGRALEPPEIVARALGGERRALACLERYEERLARSLAHVVNLLDPEVIVLGGGLSRIERLYTRVPELWGRYVFSDRVDTRLAPPAHGDASGVRGAAWLWP